MKYNAVKIASTILFSALMLKNKAQGDSLQRQIGITINMGAPASLYLVSNLYLRSQGIKTNSIYLEDFAYGIEYIDARKKIINRFALNFSAGKYFGKKPPFGFFSANVAVGREFYFKKRFIKHFVPGADVFYGKFNLSYKYKGDVACIAPFIAYSLNFKKRFQFRTAVNYFVGAYWDYRYTLNGYEKRPHFAYHLYKFLSLEIHYRFK